MQPEQRSISMRKSAKKVCAKRPAVKAKKAPGILPSPQWLKDNGYGGLVEAMREHPEAFAHIEQRGRTSMKRKGKRE